ncbi:Hypothetical predicted protein, partial [Paramuricea clavata]
MKTKDFVKQYGDQLYLNLQRLNQDFLELFFLCQRQMCGGTQNMTAYEYSYNVSSLTCLRSSRLLMKKQTNVYEVEESLPYLNGNEQLPERQSNDYIDDCSV